MNINQLELKKFFYSNKNILGLMFSSLSLFLYIFNIIDFLAWPIIIFSYILGYIIGPKEKTIVFYHFNGETLNDYTGFLNKLKNKSEYQIPNEARKNLDEIITNSLDLIDFLQKDENRLKLADSDLSIIKKIFDEYLPTVINQYIKLPKKFATQSKNENGQTAEDLIIEQLDFLNKEFTKLLNSVYSKDFNKIKFNGEVIKRAIKTS